MKRTLTVLLVLGILAGSFFGGQSWKRGRNDLWPGGGSSLGRTDARVRDESSQLRKEVDGLGAEVDAETRKEAALTAQAEAITEAKRAAVKKQVLSNLRTIQSARMQYVANTGKPAATMQEIAQLGYIKGNWLRVDSVANGEDYLGLSPDPAQPMNVKLADGREFSFDPADPEMMALPVVPGAGPNQEGTNPVRTDKVNPPLSAPGQIEADFFSGERAVNLDHALANATLNLIKEVRRIEGYADLYPVFRGQMFGLENSAGAMLKDDGADPAATATFRANLADVLFRMGNSANTSQRINTPYHDRDTANQIRAATAAIRGHLPVTAPSSP